MKNVFVLPTDKPTRLFTSDSELILAGYPATTFKTGKNIYITSDEALPYDSSIFDNGAFYHRDAVGDVHIITKHTFKPNPHFCKRIILTTDGDLIKDGVQAIDDEFLEWFVKNPSCEEVEVSEDYFKPSNMVYGHDTEPYKIIIPKGEVIWGEQQKQHIINMMKSDEELGYEEPKQEITLEEVFNEEKVKGVRELIDKHKQETIEEAAEREASLFYEKGSLDWNKYRQVFIAGAKWQRERLCDSELIQRIRASKSDAEARRIIRTF